MKNAKVVRSQEAKVCGNGKTVKSIAKCGIFPFFTSAGSRDLGFEDVGFMPMMANEIGK